MRRDPEAAKRAQQRRAREDSAPRLQQKVPRLAALKLFIKEWPFGEEAHEVSYTKLVVVDRAPALFVIPCADRACKEGGHDLTRRIIRALRDGKTEFTGKHECAGDIAGSECPLVLTFEAEASYA